METERWWNRLRAWVRAEVDDRSVIFVGPFHKYDDELDLREFMASLNLAIDEDGDAVDAPELP